jgi:indolepyruvate ferredoxin oxidoreductase alpha subunit
MKSVGLNVAADAAAQLCYFTMPGGLVVILGDDPGHLSSQNEQDNRPFFKASIFRCWSHPPPRRPRTTL